MATITHHTQTAIANDPTKAVSATAWNEGHDVTLVDADIPATIARDAEVTSAVAALSTVYQPLDSDLTSIAALSTTAFGRTFLDLVDAAAARTKLALGSLATASSIAHSATTGQTANDHHNQSHNHSAAGDGTALVPATFTIPGGGKLAAGTAFPGSPATGDIFTRTDLLYEDYYWDGAQWLSKTIYSVPLGDYATAWPIAASGIPVIIPVPSNSVGTIRNVWLIGWTLVTMVQTTNNGTNFWTVQLVGDSAGTFAGATFTTAADTVNVQTSHRQTIGAVAGTGRLYMNITKTLTPGGLFAPGILEYRKIAT